jgi:hypothetical protein
MNQDQLLEQQQQQDKQLLKLQAYEQHLAARVSLKKVFLSAGILGAYIAPIQVWLLSVPLSSVLYSVFFFANVY